MPEKNRDPRFGFEITTAGTFIFSCANCQKELERFELKGRPRCDVHDNVGPHTAIGLTADGTHPRIACLDCEEEIDRFELKTPMAQPRCEACGGAGPHVH